MNYRIPPDVLHYEAKLFFGLTAYDIMVAGMAAIFGIQKFGPVVGSVLGVIALLATKKYEGLGNRSPLVYLSLWIWHSWRPQRVVMPRVMPAASAGTGTDTKVVIYDWDGQPVIQVEGERR